MATSLHYQARILPQFLAPALCAALPIGTADAGFEAMRILIDDDIADGTPGLGVGVRSRRDPYVGEFNDTGFEPLYLYKGRWLYSNGTSFGVHLADTARFFFDVNFRYRFGRLIPEDYGTIPNELNARKSTLEGGAAAGLRTRLGEFRAEYGHDVLDRHKSQGLDLTYRYTFDKGDFSISPFVAWSLLDAKLANYYYGVTETESQATGIPAYDVGNTNTLSLGINTYWQLTDHIFLFGNYGIDFLSQDITDSPIVGEDIDTELFVGGGYFFGPVRNSKYVAKERAGEWSWRVLYGYAGDKNIAFEPMKGNFPRSELVDTNIAGFTLGKLVETVQMFDIYAKASVYRHLEHDLQADFWSFAAYMMGIFRGYTPWSEKVAFRYGFGMGASYAQEVPMIEQIKQSHKDRDTSRILTYLEWMADIPIDIVIRSKAVRNCFIGVTVVHRSGIFSSSQLNGSVGGGSDYYTLHLECLR